MMRSLFSVIALAIAIGLFVVFTQPTYDGVNAKQAKIAEYDAALAKSNACRQRSNSSIRRSVHWIRMISIDSIKCCRIMSIT